MREMASRGFTSPVSLLPFVLCLHHQALASPPVPPSHSVMRRATVLAAAFLLSATATLTSAQQPADAALARQLDAYTTQAFRDWDGVGLAIAVVKDGRLVFAKGYGSRELGKPGAVDSATLFAIGSTTKAMTAAALGMLVDEGKVRWDDPVTKHLPDFRLSDPWLTPQITVRDLL